MGIPDSEDEFAFAAKALPTPTDTPYRSPSRMSRRSSRHGSSSPPTVPSPGEDAANDENISILDPRRFTPTLHANLVSEILSLRRDVESKTTFIEALETNLHSAKANCESLSTNLSANSQETL